MFRIVTFWKTTLCKTTFTSYLISGKFIFRKIVNFSGTTFCILEEYAAYLVVCARGRGKDTRASSRVTAAAAAADRSGKFVAFCVRREDVIPITEIRLKPDEPRRVDGNVSGR